MATCVICCLQWNLAAKRFGQNRFKFTIRGLVFSILGFFAFNAIIQNFAFGLLFTNEAIVSAILGFACIFGISSLGLFFAKKQWKSQQEPGSELDEIGNENEDRWN